MLFRTKEQQDIVWFLKANNNICDHEGQIEIERLLVDVLQISISPNNQPNQNDIILLQPT